MSFGAVVQIYVFEIYKSKSAIVGEMTEIKTIDALSLNVTGG